MNLFLNETVNVLSWSNTSETSNILRFCATEDSVLDFNKIYPKPEGLNSISCFEEHCGLGIVMYAKSPKSSYKHPLIPKLGEWEWTQFMSIVGPVFERCPGLCETNADTLANFVLSEDASNTVSMGMEALNNILLYGDADITEWRKHRWGSASNAVNPSINRIGGQTTISFALLSGVPVPLLQHLSYRFYETEFVCESIRSGRSEFRLFRRGLVYKQTNAKDSAKPDCVIRGVEEKEIVFQLVGTYPPI